VMAYEFGIKSDFWDRRARINVDSFYYSYDDMQLTTLATINNAPGQFTTNAGKSTIYGVELDTQFKITRDLSIMVTYAYVNAEFDEYFNRDPRNPTAPLNPNDPAGLGRTDLSGNKVPYVSDHTVNLGAQYETEIGSAGRLIASVNYNWHSELFLREYNDRRIDRVVPNSKTDVTLTWHVADSGLKLTGYVTNLENNVEKNNIYISPGFIGESATTAYTRPRTFGIRADYKF
jgi:iron complex outermembrane recepter protein